MGKKRQCQERTEEQLDLFYPSRNNMLQTEPHSWPRVSRVHDDIVRVHFPFHAILLHPAISSLFLPDTLRACRWMVPRRDQAVVTNGCGEGRISSEKSENDVQLTFFFGCCHDFLCYTTRSQQDAPVPCLCSMPRVVRCHLYLVTTSRLRECYRYAMHER